MRRTRDHGKVRRLVQASIACSAALVLACGDGSTSPGQPQVWGSDEANLSVQNSAWTLRIFNSGSCYGYFGDITQAVPAGQFDLSGTLTEFINIPPGQRRYAAQFAGTASGALLTITVTVPALQKSFGPYVLTRGVSSTKGQCFYP
jgi:hypothetical protein